MSAAEPAAAATRPDRSPGVIPGDRSPVPIHLRNRSVAVVHEWIAERAGSEKVFERLASLFPSADLFALTATPGVRLDTGGRPIRTTALDRHFFRARRAISLPLMPITWRVLRREVDHDIVITSSHAFAREVVSRRSVETHLCYVHSPMRYAWERATDPRTSGRRGVAVPAAVLRTWDRRSVGTVDSFAVNSRETRDRVRRHYGRDSEVIHPPVDTAFFRQAHRDPAGYLFSFGRFIDYKRFDVAIAVAERVGRPLVIAGSGPREAELRAMGERATVPVRMVTRPSDDELLGLLGGAEALLFPGVEDFGLVPVEAQAAGVPVVGPALGGLRDTVDHLTTGVLVDEPTVEALAAGVETALASQLGGTPCRTWAERFSPERFDQEIQEWVTASF